jgi:hypothetical protein
MRLISMATGGMTCGTCVATARLTMANSAACRHRAKVGHKRGVEMRTQPLGIESSVTIRPPCHIIKNCYCLYFQVLCQVIPRFKGMVLFDFIVWHWIQGEPHHFGLPLVPPPLAGAQGYCPCANRQFGGKEAT